MYDKSTGKVLEALARMPSDLRLRIAKDFKAANFQKGDPPDVQQMKLQLLFRKYDDIAIPALNVRKVQ